MTLEKKKKIKKIIDIAFWIFIITTFALTIWYSVIYFEKLDAENNNRVANLSVVDENFLSVWSVFQNIFIIIGLPLSILKVNSIIKTYILYRKKEKEEQEKMNFLRKQKLKKYYKLKKEKDEKENTKKELSNWEKKIKEINKLLLDKYNIFVNETETLEILKITKKTNSAYGLQKYIYDKTNENLPLEKIFNLIKEIEKK